MLAYPIHLEDDDDTVLATSPDFPELTTYGTDRNEAVARSADAVEEAIAARMHNDQDIPPPSQGPDCAVVPALTATKVMLYQGMRDQGIGKEELARRLGCSLTKVDRLLDIQRRSKLEHLDIALRAIDRQPHVASP